MSSFQVWLKNIDNNEEDAFKVDCEGAMDIDSLKKVILKELMLGGFKVSKIYRDNSGAESIAPDIEVKMPQGGGIGASANRPYFYSLGNWCYICCIPHDPSCVS